MQSSDPKLPAVGRLSEVGVTLIRKKSRKPSVQNLFFFLLLRSSVIFEKSEKNIFLKKSNFSESVFDFLELGVLLMRTCLLPLFPPPLLLF